MKKLIYILFVAFVATMCWGCNDDDPQPQVTDGITGEWKLVEWEGNQAVDFEVYMSLHTDGSFELFQRIEHLTYDKFEGVYSALNGAFTGKYKNGQPLGAEYDYTLSETGNILEMVSRSERPEKMIYNRVMIPEEVRQNAQTRSLNTETSPLL